MEFCRTDYPTKANKKYDLHSIGLQDKENFFLDELINIINDLWYEIDNN